MYILSSTQCAWTITVLYADPYPSPYICNKALKQSFIFYMPQRIINRLSMLCHMRVRCFKENMRVQI